MKGTYLYCSNLPEILQHTNRNNIHFLNRKYCYLCNSHYTNLCNFYQTFHLHNLGTKNENKGNNNHKKKHQDTKATIQQRKSFYMLNRFGENSVQNVFVLKTSLIWKKTSRLKLTKLELDMYFLSSYMWYVLLIYTTSFKSIKSTLWMQQKIKIFFFVDLKIWCQIKVVINQT